MLGRVEDEIVECFERGGGVPYASYPRFHQVMAEDSVQALRPDGMLLMQDIRASTRLENNMDHRIGAFLYTISCLHCMSVSLAQGSAGLGTMWGEEQALAMLREAGFERIEVAQLPHDFQNSDYLARKR